ncbi:MAG: ABC transporter ATP-binding protein [Bacteroidales bacterium]|nr:ABC transporter ATP-binding protein [Bacteroidales bacterium]
MPDNDIILKTNNLEIGYFHHNKKLPVFSHISLTARRGELISLIGRNGSGKSTLLKSIVRINKILGGDILLEGQSIYNYKLKEWAKKIAFVSTEPLTVSNLAVKELVTLGRHPYTNWMFYLTDKDNEIIEEAISLVKINHLASKNIDEISDGERQRAMIARALAQNSQVILLDEPTAYLDLPNKYEIIHLLHDLARNEQKTIIFSSHDLNISIGEADKLWLMDKDITLEGAPEDIILNGTFSHIFDNSIVCFDSNTGEIKLTRSIKKEVYLEGEEKPYLWTKRALERTGYIITKNQNNAIKINITRQANELKWNITINGINKVFNSIYDLNVYLKLTKD